MSGSHTRRVTLTDEQYAALEQILAYLADPTRTDPFSLHGLAGTGKTTVLAEVAKQVPHALLCCLTGKAASVLRRKTGLNVTTIHAAFYKLRNVTQDDTGREILDFETKHFRGELAHKIVLIDESSMVSREMMLDLLKTGAKIVGCGDPGQLPPVEGEQYFNWADVTLHTIHRQALESPIIRQAHRVRAGEGYRADGDGFQVLDRCFSNDEMLLADVILTFRNSSRHRANDVAREIRGYASGTPPRVGEPMMCKKNAPRFGIFNGGVYTLTRDFNPGDITMRLNIDGTPREVPAWLENTGGPKTVMQEKPIEFAFGYALTVHKSQGSEWPTVLLFDEYNMRDGRIEWVYSAVTRAAQRLIVTRFPFGYVAPPPLHLDF